MCSRFPDPVRWIASASVVVPLLLISFSCEREKRDFTSASGVAAHTARLTDLQPGSPSPPPMTEGPYRDNAFAMAEGKRLYGWFNCVGCHHHGGGGIGPPLMDHRWIYGHRPDQIYSTIVQGRPNGMPSFAGRLTDQQVWQLVAYVQSMSGNARIDVAPGRDDDMATSEPEARREPKPPVQTGHR
jgi:cytochrome c oxidase cbb3-type subunit 3